MSVDQANYTQAMTGQTALDNSCTQVEDTDPVHKTSVIESPSSIDSVKIPIVQELMNLESRTQLTK